MVAETVGIDESESTVVEVSKSFVRDEAESDLRRKDGLLVALVSRDRAAECRRRDRRREWGCDMVVSSRETKWSWYSRACIQAQRLWRAYYRRAVEKAWPGVRVFQQGTVVRGTR